MSLTSDMVLLKQSCKARFEKLKRFRQFVPKILGKDTKVFAEMWIATKKS